MAFEVCAPRISLVKKNVSVANHLLQFYLDAAFNRKKNEKKNISKAAVEVKPAANK